MIQKRISIGVIENQQQQVLVGKRKAGTHLEGFWEFPGGKVTPQESFKIALRRELYEELGIRAYSMLKLVELQYQYQDRQLHFQIFKVTNFSGQVESVEAQELQWVSQSKLATLKLPPANRAIVDALTMPVNYMIADQDVLKERLFLIVKKQLQAGIALIQYRAYRADKNTYISNANKLRDLCAEFGAKLICNCSLAWTTEISGHRIHLNSHRLRDVNSQLSHYKGLDFFSASCHSEEEVKMANNLGVRCMLIGPVNQTNSHAYADILGWSRFSRLCFMANSPVYALGGMGLNDYQNAIVHGAQGIAAIRAFMD